MLMTDIKRCPFCGSKAKIDEPSRGAPGWQVFCLRCEAVATSVFGTEAEAVAAWNTRADEK
jgi:Lar family restriction alleviation protein